MAELTIVGKINYYHELGSIITQLKLNIDKKLVPLISFLVPLTGPGANIKNKNCSFFKFAVSVKTYNFEGYLNLCFYR